MPPSLFVYNLPFISFDESALRLLFDGDVINSIIWGESPHPVGRFAIVSGPDAVNYSVNPPNVVAQGNKIGFALSPVNCFQHSVIQAVAQTFKDDCGDCRGSRGRAGATRYGHGDDRGRGRGRGKGRVMDVGSKRARDDADGVEGTRPMRGLHPEGKSEQMKEHAYGAATGGRKVTFDDDDVEGVAADCVAVNQNLSCPCPTEISIITAKLSTPENTSRSKSIPDVEAVDTVPHAPPVVEGATVTAAVSSPQQPPEVGLRSQGGSSNICKFCASVDHLSRHCKNKR